jgi:hypothetical protein
VTERGLSDVQALGSPAEVELLRHGDEVLHQPQIEAFDRRNLLIVACAILDFTLAANDTPPPR